MAECRDLNHREVAVVTGSRTGDGPRSAGRAARAPRLPLALAVSAAPVDYVAKLTVGPRRLRRRLGDNAGASPTPDAACAVRNDLVRSSLHHAYGGGLCMAVA